MLVSAQQKCLGKKKKGDISESGCWSSQVTVMGDEALLPRGWLNTCLPMGRDELIPWVISHASVAFASPIKLSLS